MLNNVLIIIQLGDYQHWRPTNHNYRKLHSLLFVRTVVCLSGLGDHHHT